MTSTIIYSSEQTHPYVYLLTHITTEQFYIGCRWANKKPSSEDIFSYKSSSKTIKKLGFENFSCTIIAEFPIGSRQERTSAAYQFEQNMIREMWGSPLSLNKSITSCGGSPKFVNNTISNIIVEVSPKKYISIDKNDDRVVSGELKNFHLNKVCAIDGEGARSLVSCDDSRLLSGELKSTNSGFVRCVDEFGNNLTVTTAEFANDTTLRGHAKGRRVLKDAMGNFVNVFVGDDDFSKNGFTHSSSGMVVVKDKDNKTQIVSNKDPRYLSGELKFISSGTTRVRNKDGAIICIAVDDPRFISGELSGQNKGKRDYIDTAGVRHRVFPDNPNVLDGIWVSIKQTQTNYN